MKRKLEKELNKESKNANLDELERITDRLDELKETELRVEIQNLPEDSTGEILVLLEEIKNKQTPDYSEQLSNLLSEVKKKI